MNASVGPSMSDRLGATAEAVIKKYEGDLSKLREAAKNDPAQIRKLVKEEDLSTAHEQDWTY